MLINRKIIRDYTRRRVANANKRISVYENRRQSKDSIVAGHAKIMSGIKRTAPWLDKNEHPRKPDIAENRRFVKPGDVPSFPL